MSNYDSTGKTEWFIEKMRSGWFSRSELVSVASREFPDVHRGKIEGTIGQYWSDCANPKWSTYKAVCALGLKVVESGGRRHIVGNRVPQPALMREAAPSSHLPETNKVRTSAKPVRPDQCSAAVVRSSAIQSDKKVGDLWNSDDATVWNNALNRYWDFVRAANLDLEKKMENLDVAAVKVMSPSAWYKFLLDEYFRWKYTAPNGYASTTMSLKKYAANDQLDVLHKIKGQIFAADKKNVRHCLALASSIRGLGIAGASGLLAVLFPTQFGTADQFVVKTLSQIPELPENNRLAAMKPESLTLEDGLVLIQIMRKKAAQLNKTFVTDGWTPRKVDMVLWTCGR